MGINRVGRFSQHDTLVGAAIIGAVLIGPLAGGLVGAFLGLAAVYIPAIIIAVLVVSFVIVLGSYSQWQEAEDRTDLQREEAAYYKGIIEGRDNQGENYKTKGALLEEALALIITIHAGSDDQLPAYTSAAQEWRERTRDFLNKAALEGAAGAATFYRSFDLANSAHFTYRGTAIAGDRAFLANQINDAMGELSHMYMPENTYLSFSSVKAMEDAQENVKARGTAS